MSAKVAEKVPHVFEDQYLINISICSTANSLDQFKVLLWVSTLNLPSGPAQRIHAVGLEDLQL